MDWLTWTVGLLVGVLVALGIPMLWLFLRRRWLARQGGMFECAVRLQTTTPGTGWVLGVARYSAESLEWFRSLSLSLRPRLVFDRSATASGRQRRASPLESVLLYDENQIVILRSERIGMWELAMSPDSLTGLLSWLESAPPGQTGPRSPSPAEP